MKDDINDILDSMWNNGRLNLNKAADNNEKAQNDLNEVTKQSEQFSKSLQSSIEELTKEAQSELTELEERLKKDGLNGAGASNLKTVSAEGLGNPEPSLSANIEDSIKKAAESVSQNIIGQDTFIAALAVAFRRPFVMGVKDGMPSSRTMLVGRNGTGKHAALESFTNELQSLGVLKGGNVAYIDMSKYADNASEKSFIQDLYSAIKSPSEVLAFENFEKAHTSVSALVSSLFIDGSVPLSGRYAEQKGMLVDIGNALVPNAVSDIKASGKYLFFITEKDEKKIVDAFGAAFVKSMDDICKTNILDEESLQIIAENELESFKQEAKKRYGYELSFTKLEVETLAGRFIPDEGASSIKAYSEVLFRALGDYKLSKNSNEDSTKTGEIVSENGELTITFAGDKIGVKSGTDSENDSLEEVKKELDEVIGLDFIKSYILSLEDNFKVQQLRRAEGLKADFPSMHMIFTGNPGTGKTTVARIVSRYLKAIGVLSGGQLVEVTRADLVGRYVGHTAPLTQKAIDSALGGVLFIDEAYALYRGNDDSFGLEAIDTLVKGMEDNRENLVVILAGYSHEMEVFLTSNSGLKSRFPNIIEFPDYTAQELVDITKSIVKSKGYKMREDCEEPLYVYFDIEQNSGDPRTNGNGRMARNKVEEAILNCSKRNMAESPENRDLELLIPEDFNLKSTEETEKA